MCAGKDATIDGSVMTSHTDCCANYRVHVVPAQTFEKGAMAPVYWGIQDLTPSYDNYGEVIGEIPQVEKTYSYFHDGYPHMNEYQLGIGECTISQKEELGGDYLKEAGKQIMTIEQAEIFAHQRTKTAREAIKVMGALMEKYGFLPSCCGPGSTDGECLLIADTKEVWVLEVFSVGNDWTPESGKIGALWAAQRVPDDHIHISSNESTIREIDLSNPDYFMASENYMQVAIDHGWYDPKSGKPFIWAEAYAPAPTEGNMNRIWLFHTTFAPNLRKYHTFDPISYYPFSIKPEKKVSVQDLIAFQRSFFEGTIFDMTADLDWLVPTSDGKMVKSPLTTPYPTKDMRDLLDITWHRPVCGQGYGCVIQLRDWLPDPIGGLMWFFVENQSVSMYVPIYAGVKKINPLYNTMDPNKFSEGAIKWVIEFVDTLISLKYQDAIKDLRAMRDPLEAEIFAKQPEIEAKALELYKKDPEEAKDFLTDYTWSRMDEIAENYRELRYILITKYCGNKQGLSQSYRGDNFKYFWPK
jgi:dipeptidase